jgi:F-type H+-transporting ATPase subunit delta
MGLAREDRAVEEVQRSLEELQRLLHDHPLLWDVLTRQSITAHQQVAVVRELLSSLTLHPLVGRFLLLLVQKKRMPAFHDIVREFGQMYDELSGIVRVTLISAAPLTRDMEQGLVSRIEAQTKRKVILKKEVDSAIIGGIVTRVGDLLFDGSISTQLARLKQTLLH